MRILGTREKIAVKSYILLIQTIIPAVATLLWFRNLSKASNRITKGVVSIAFDDGRKSQFTYAFPLMKARRINGTFYVTTDKIRDFSQDSSFMSINELQNLQAEGNEIGSHSKTHQTLPPLSDDQIQIECTLSKETLQNNGLKVNNFAYPRGQTTDHINSIVSQYYRTGRSGYKKPYLMHLLQSQFELAGFPGEYGDSSSLIRLKYITNLIALTNSYAIVFFHNVLPNKSEIPFTISTQDFASFLDYGTLKGLQFLTVNRALELASRSEKKKSFKSNYILY